MTTARLLVFVAIFFLIGSVANAALSHRLIDFVSLGLVIVSARFLIVGAARRGDALAKRLVRALRME